MTIPSRRYTLTNRQNEVLNLLDIGESRQAIADRLELSEGRVSQIVSQLKAHFHIKGATDVRLVQVYRESLGDVPDANDPIPGEEIANDLFDWLPAPVEDADPGMSGESLVPDALNGPHGTALRLALIVLIPVALLGALLLVFAVLSALSERTDKADVSFDTLLSDSRLDND